MTSLSWALYAADVLSKLSVVAFLVVVVCLGTQIYFWFVIADSKDTDATLTPLYKASSRLRVAMLVATLFIIFAPRPNAVYQIIAVELGNVAIQTPEVQKLRQVINLQLDEMLEQEND